MDHTSGGVLGYIVCAVGDVIEAGEMAELVGQHRVHVVVGRPGAVRVRVDREPLVRVEDDVR